MQKILMQGKSMNHFICFFSIVITVLSGCVSPAHVFTVIPAENEMHWTYGVGLIEKTDHDISVQVGFEDNRNDMLCFYITINNKSENIIFVDPKEFECIAQSRIDQDSLHNPVKSTIAHAIDPETQIQQKDIQISEENSSYQSSNTLEAGGMLMNLVLDVATIGKPEFEEQQKEKEQQREDARIRSIDRDNEHSARIESLNQEKVFWQSQTFRKTTLLPGQTIEGKLLFYRDEHAKFLQLRFPFPQSYIDIWFIQKEVQP
jgi:hypothetical protein